MFTPAALQETLIQHASSTSFAIAYSGGLDSHVLLYAMHKLRQKNADITIQAIHVNHQLNPHAQAWALHCQQVCDALNIILHIETITVPLKPGDSLEEEARHARYHCLKKYVDKHTVLLTAHTVDDQAETFLLQALRGSGPKGLSAMPVVKSFDDSVLIRPLLSFSKGQLEQYAKDNRLIWIEDDSNVDPRFLRNFLRHVIFPELKKQCPSVAKNFARSARLMTEHEKIIAGITKEDFEKIKTDDIRKINLNVLRLFSPERQRLLLREWLSRNQLRVPNEKHLRQIQRDVINASCSAKPLFSLKNLTILRDRVKGVLILHPIFTS